MIKKLLNNESRSIASAAVILGAASLISRLLGLIRDRVLAGQFGAGNELDIYYAAFRIPDLVYSLLVAGAISAGFIPIFIDYLNKGKTEENSDHWYLANSILNITTVSLIVICFLAAIFTSSLVKLVAPGFSPDKLAATVELTRVMFLAPVFLGLSAVLGGILQSFRRFFVYSLGPIMYNLGIIFGALVLVRYYGLIGLSYGVVIGAFWHMAIQVPAAYMCGFRWKPVFDFKFKGVKRILKVMPPRVLSLTLTHINFWIMTIMASFLAVGSIAIYNLAHNIWSFPLGVFGISFVLAAFPMLSETAQKNDLANFVKTFSLTARQILFFTLPAMIFFVVLRAQIVRVILGTGMFDWQDTILTLETLAFFSIALFAEALILLILRGFFAWEDTKTPFLIGLIATVIRLSLAWFFSRSMGVPGLALGFSIGSLIYFFLLFMALRKKLGVLDEVRIFVSGMKMLFASLGAGLAVYIALNLLAPLVNMNTGPGVFTQGLLAGIVGILIYFLLAWILRLKELNLFLSSLFNRLPWKEVEVRP